MIENYNIQKCFDTTKNQSYQSGIYIVSVPIGNLADITLRAIHLLSISDIIYCEDTRTTAKLLNTYSIKNKKLLKFTDHANINQIQEVLDNAKSKIICVVSDAGTPLVSDPGVNLISKARKQNIPVYSIPGASALTSAISICGAENLDFLFYGFFEKNKFKNILPEIAKNNNYNLVFFDNPKSIKKSFEIIKSILENCSFDLTISLELTKINERVIKVNSNDTDISILQDLKGEIVCILSNVKPNICNNIINNADKTKYLKNTINKIIQEDSFLEDLSVKSKCDFIIKYKLDKFEDKKITKKELYNIVSQL